MNRTLIVGLALVVLGFLGYLVGVAADVGLVGPYPGQAFSVTGVMVGITLLAVGLGERGERTERTEHAGRDERGDRP